MMTTNLPIAFLGPEQLVFFIPILGVVAVIVSVLTRHQQRMAEIMHQGAATQGHDEIGQLRQEVYELKQLIHQQTIALDTYASAGRQPVDASLQKRLGEH